MYFFHKQPDENSSEYLHEEFVDEDDYDDEPDVSYDVFATLPKAKPTTTNANILSDFDLASTQTLPRSYKIKSDESKAATAAFTTTTTTTTKTTAARSQSVGELSLEHRERGRVQVFLTSDHPNFNINVDLI